MTGRRADEGDKSLADLESAKGDLEHVATADADARVRKCRAKLIETNASKCRIR